MCLILRNGKHQEIFRGENNRYTEIQHKIEISDRKRKRRSPDSIANLNTI